MCKIETLELISSLNKIVAEATMSNAFDQLHNAIRLMNRFQDSFSYEQVRKINLKGKKPFLFFKADDRYELSVTQREAFISIIKQFERDPYGINRSSGEVSKADIFLGNINGIWTNNLLTFERTSSEVRTTIQKQALCIVKGLGRITADWIR